MVHGCMGLCVCVCMGQTGGSRLTYAYCTSIVSKLLFPSEHGGVVLACSDSGHAFACGTSAAQTKQNLVQPHNDVFVVGCGRHGRGASGETAEAARGVKVKVWVWVGGCNRFSTNPPPEARGRSLGRRVTHATAGGPAVGSRYHGAVSRGC